MKYTLEIDILNDNALKLLQDLEVLKLIRVRKRRPQKKESVSIAQYKGAMQRQSVKEIDEQLNELRSSWE